MLGHAVDANAIAWAFTAVTSRAFTLGECRSHKRMHVIEMTLISAFSQVWSLSVRWSCNLFIASSLRVTMQQEPADNVRAVIHSSALCVPSDSLERIVCTQ